MITMKLFGFDALEKSLRELGSDKTIRQVMSDGLLEAGQPVADEATSRARKRSGKMAASIEVSATLSHRQRRGTPRPGPDEAQVFIGPKPIGPAVLIEFGTAERHTKSGKSTGAGPAFPFMRPAWEGNKFAVLAHFVGRMGPAIERAAAAIARRNVSST